MRKFEKAKALLSNKNGKPSYEDVLEAALDEFLKAHDPETRKQRREERREKARCEIRACERPGDNGVVGRREQRRVSHSRVLDADPSRAHPRRYEGRRLRAGQGPLHVRRLNRQALRRDA